MYIAAAFVQRLRPDVRDVGRQQYAAHSDAAREILGERKQPAAEAVPLEFLAYGYAEPRDEIVGVPKRDITYHFPAMIREKERGGLFGSVKEFHRGGAVAAVDVEKRPRLAAHLVEKRPDKRLVVLSEFPDHNAVDDAFVHMNASS